MAQQKTKKDAPKAKQAKSKGGEKTNGKFEFRPTPMLDKLESGPWPSFITGFKTLARRTHNTMVRGIVEQLEHSYETKTGYWKGGTVGVRGYGGGIIARFSMIPEKYPEAKEFHTLRIMPPAGLHYNTRALRDICDVWERYGSGIVVLHGQSGDLQLQGVGMDNVQACFDDLNKLGWDLGGAGPAVRTSMACVGPARCEQACYDTLKMMRKVVNTFLDEMHRPAYPYKFKFKFSGCPNDCMNSIQRSDFSVIGTWRDDIQIDQAEVGKFIDKKGLDVLVNDVIALCPTRAIQLQGKKLIINNKDCVRCMHCINVMPKALSPGNDQGVTLLLGGKRTLKVGDLLGSVIVPFMKMSTDKDIDAFIELARRIMEFWADNALDHERVGEFIERIGMMNFLDGVGLPPHPAMVSHPRSNSYIKVQYNGDGAK